MKYNYNFNDEEFDEELEELINEEEFYRKSNKKRNKNRCAYCEFMSVENCYKCKNNPEKKIYNK